MSTERNYVCLSHEPRLHAESTYLTESQLREAYTERAFLVAVLDRFGNVDNDTDLTHAVVFLRQHPNCAVGIWTEGETPIIRLEGGPTRG